MEEEKNKGTVVKVKVAEDGRIVIKTRAKELPTKVVQELIDNIVGNVVFMFNRKEKETPTRTKKELIFWQVVAIVELITLFIAILKLKGMI